MDRFVLSDADAHLALPRKSDEAALPLSFSSSVIFVDVVDVDLDAECNWDLSDVPRSGVIDVFPVSEGTSRSLKRRVARFP